MNKLHLKSLLIFQIMFCCMEFKVLQILMVRPGLINLDFADVETVMASMGKAMMGTGEAEGEGRAAKAAEMAISNPLIDDYTLKGAKGPSCKHHWWQRFKTF